MLWQKNHVNQSANQRLIRILNIVSTSKRVYQQRKWNKTRKYLFALITLKDVFSLNIWTGFRNKKLQITSNNGNWSYLILRLVSYPLIQT